MGNWDQLERQLRPEWDLSGFQLEYYWSDLDPKWNPLLGNKLDSNEYQLQAQ